MKITPFDIHDDALLGRFYAIMREAELHGREHMPYWSERECAVMFRREEPAETFHLYAAFDDAAQSQGAVSADTMIGNALMILPQHDNTNFAFLGVHVAPEQRGRGIGSALTDFVVEEARKAGRTELLTETNLAFEHRDSHPYRTFLEHRGFALANVEVRRIMDLPVADDRIQQWIDESAPHHREYRLETYVDDIPDDLIPSLVHLHNQLALDAPTGDLEFEAEAMTPEGFKIRRAKLKEMGRTTYETVAIAPDGEVVAQSTIGIGADDTENAYQWGTIVRRDHRGHRLGMAVKAINLRAVQAAYPDHQRIMTTNAETNQHMVAINEQLGFKPVELLAEFQRKLERTD